MRNRFNRFHRTYNRATANLKQLHWLPVQQRIQFKTLLLAYKALHGMGPKYLTGMLSWHHPVRALRSAEFPALKVPGYKTKYGQMAWGVRAAALWNALPHEVCGAETVTSFKKRLKTHLFLTAFIDWFCASAYERFLIEFRRVINKILLLLLYHQIIR